MEIKIEETEDSLKIIKSCKKELKWSFIIGIICNICIIYPILKITPGEYYFGFLLFYTPIFLIIEGIFCHRFFYEVIFIKEDCIYLLESFRKPDIFNAEKILVENIVEIFAKKFNGSVLLMSHNIFKERKTIKNQVEINGIGLHKGKQIKMILKPVSKKTGIVFERVDVQDKNNVIKVNYKNLFDLERGTNIQNENGVKLHTIEHFMSALSVCGITDVFVEIEGNEMPILDGSSIQFVEKIKSAGVLELEEEIEPLIITEPVIFSDEKNGKYVLALPYDGFKISYTIDFNHTFLKSEYFEFEVNLENYEKEIASCRTFAFDYEIDFLKKNNLALGGSLDNAIVIGKDGPLNPEGLRFENEFVRHKILDIIGDLYVLGTPIKAHIIAIKAGHFVNAKLTEMIAKKFEI